MPILSENAFEFISRSPEQTKRIGARLGSKLKKGDLICLCGELGAGKTTFAQGMVQGWGSPDQVTSPTFVLINQYRRMDGAEINHLDAYRLTDEREAEILDLDGLMDQGILVVEWPERIRKIIVDLKKNFNPFDLENFYELLQLKGIIADEAVELYLKKFIAIHYEDYETAQELTLEIEKAKNQLKF